MGHTGQTGEGHRSDWCHPEQSQLLPHSICAALSLRFGLDKHETTWYRYVLKNMKRDWTRATGQTGEGRPTPNLGFS
jgi:hypothetical protein